MAALKGRNLLSLADLTADEMQHLLTTAAKIKSGEINPQCPQKILGLVFKKASTRTRVSFTAAMYKLGGQVIDLNANLTQIGRGEPTADTARVLDRYLDVLAIRTFAQTEVEEFAHHADIPILNALTDLEHPCQILADLQTVQEEFDQLAGLTMTYLGDGNNVAHSLILGCALVGMNVRVATPAGYEPDEAIVKKAKSIAGDRSEVMVTPDPKAAIEGAHALYTDVWASMGQEDLAETRIPVFEPYQINESALAIADKSAIVLHCLPAHRGEEITEGVMEGKQSRIWNEAENRMHAQQALLAAVLGAA
ncbi:ornithine carbamoyltransferase [cf. Phormidesmis sp. LEGE 11477]|uniref:ornithine carbamoyltransferase n=1 Tax=cf. Phormidesmis sp. LEGE 11477 TaxID=1828680 RepID=UPI00187E2AD0|nr:ornithine carbamoyltransferase [cf. Phormidesmis sp. LEGE 11477]MBE9063339.1 ornithine carbamoyltransferase [cf. Phormidesmis sp. LEGE 11477]